MLPAKKKFAYNASLIEREDLSDTLTIFHIQPDGDTSEPGNREPPVPEFVAGQYAVLGVYNEDEPEKGFVRRAYSIASPPEERRWLEFYIRYVDHPTSNNPLTHLFWKMQVGSRLWLGPKITGRFTLAHTVGEDDPRQKIFVAAGTGLAPFVSILKNVLQQNVATDGKASNFILLHGASHPHDLAYKEDLEKALNLVRQRYFPTISRPRLHPDWRGDTGRVETSFDAEKLEDLERRLGFEPGHIAPERCVAYICGLQGTIANTLIALFRRGFIPNDRRIRAAVGLPKDVVPSLFFEQYDSMPILDLSNAAFIQSLRETFPTGLSS